MKNKDYNYLWLTLIAIIVILLFMGSNMFGSKTDWLSQHSVFPEYFRMLFYETGNLFPNLALNLGAGQNIFNFSYYGLFNPLYMISYFFPFVDMVNYIMFMSMIIVLIGTLLMYYFLKSKFNNKISFIGSLLYLFACPIIFHAHRHVMFVNYMPFLILALIGVDNYFKKNKSLLLIISIFLMFMTSYYYSIGGSLTIALYAIYVYLGSVKKFKIKDIVINGFKFMMPCLLGVLLSSMLLFPTLYVIFTSRTDFGESLHISELIMPTINMGFLLYSNYALGLTAVSVIALLGTLLFKKKDIRFLSISLLVILLVPLFTYLLNGGLYIRAKVLIPLIPLFIYIITYFLNYIKKIDVKKLLVLLFICNFIIWLSGYRELYYYGDILVSLIFLLIFIYFKKSFVLFGIVILAFINCFIYNKTENYVSHDYYDDVFDDTKIIKEVLLADDGFYRFNNVDDVSSTMNKIYDINYFQTSLYSSTYNSYYKDFLEQDMRVALPLRNILDQVQVDNVLLQTLMGVKYIKTNYPSKDFVKVLDDIYLNPHAYPLGFASSQVSSVDTYNTLSFPYNLEYLMNSIIASGDYKVDTQIKDYDFNWDMTNIDYEVIEDGYLVKGEQEVRIPLTEKITDILIIKFDLLEASKCSVGDLSITINGVTNKLTCSSWMYYNNNESFEYVISSMDGIDSLDISFSKGDFKLSDMEVYTMSSISNFNYDSFIIDDYSGDSFKGHIDVQKQGYFMFTLPYDKGYTIYVDGKEVNYELVSQAFIGFPIEAGSHEINVKYEAPFFDAGKLMSLASLGCTIVYLNFNKKRNNV